MRNRTIAPLPAADRFLAQAIEFAQRANPSPNPRVGAIVIKNGKLIGTGYHRKAGGPHAEIIALKKAGSKTNSATLYLTLEPCCHQGRTPPCTDAIIQAGIKRVVVAMRDPNPLVAGKGIAQLRKAGVLVTLLSLTHPIVEQAQQLNLAWIKRITTGMPYVTLKIAQSLDGKICTSTGDSKWITGIPARQYVHQLRTQSDAILVGIRTILADDPQLTARSGKNFALRSNDRQPLRVVLDRELRIPLTANVLKGGCLVFCERPDKEKITQLEQRGAIVNILPELTIRAVMQELGSREINRVLIEGGSAIATAALEERVVDHALFFIAPKLIGGKDAKTMFEGMGMPTVADALRLKNVSITSLGDDILVQGDFS